MSWATRTYRVTALGDLTTTATIPAGFRVHIYIYMYIIFGVVMQPGIQSKRHCTRGLSHLNSDKPFWTRRYYTVQENPGSITAAPPTLIIYPGPCRPRWADQHRHRQDLQVSLFQSLGVLTGYLKAKPEYTVIPLHGASLPPSFGGSEYRIVDNSRTRRKRKTRSTKTHDVSCTTLTAASRRLARMCVL